jgi:hypothetical protein
MFLFKMPVLLSGSEVITCQGKLVLHWSTQLCVDKQKSDSANGLIVLIAFRLLEECGQLTTSYTEYSNLVYTRNAEPYSCHVSDTTDETVFMSTRLNCLNYLSVIMMQLLI